MYTDIYIHRRFLYKEHTTIGLQTFPSVSFHRCRCVSARRTPRPCSVCGSPRLCRRRERCLIMARFGRWPLAWRQIWAVYRCLTLRYSLLLSVWVDPSAEHNPSGAAASTAHSCLHCRITSQNDAQGGHIHPDQFIGGEGGADRTEHLTYTDTKKQSPTTGARANNTLHK